MGIIITIVFWGGLIWFFVIRPKAKRKKREKQSQLAALEYQYNTQKETFNQIIKSQRDSIENQRGTLEDIHKIDINASIESVLNASNTTSNTALLNSATKWIRECWDSLLETAIAFAEMTPPIDNTDELAKDAENVLSILIHNRLFYEGTGIGTFDSEAFIKSIREGFAQLAEINPVYGNAAKIAPCEQLWSRLTAYESRSAEAGAHGMMLPGAYGQTDKELLAEAQTMTRHEAETTLDQFEAARLKSTLDAVEALNPRKLLLALWYFGMEKPYQAGDLSRAQNCCRWYFNGEYADVRLAEWYAQRQMGGVDAVAHVEKKELEHVSAKIAEQWASGLMWLQAYKQEQKLLQGMLSSNMPMSAKAQERLHALNNGGGNAPGTHQAVSAGDQFFFDVSAPAWQEAEYNSLFESLAFQDKKLTYGLAVRDEDNDLLLPAGVSLPGKDEMLAKFRASLDEEYGDQAEARNVECVMLSGSGKENMAGVLVTCSECRQLGIVVNLVRIGKKVNIKFYTVFRPEGLALADQKQQAISLSKKMSPSVSMWENSLKSTILTAIQQMLNSSAQGGGQPESPLPQVDAKHEEPVF